MFEWSYLEIEAVVEDYLDMLDCALRGEPYSRADHNRALRPNLDNRTKASVERQHQNISAVMLEFGRPYLDEYPPHPPSQELLRAVVAEKLSAARDLDRTLFTIVSSRSPKAPPVSDMIGLAVPPPHKEHSSTEPLEKHLSSPVPIKRNFLEIESRNSALSLAGEKLIVHYEHERLCHAGKRKLADQILHVSLSRGDEDGYDILSYEIDGRERFIEVKTTHFGAFTPFYASRHEIETSERLHTGYHLYRLYKFAEAPRLFILQGPLLQHCDLEPVSFEARVI